MRKYIIPIIFLFLILSIPAYTYQKMKIAVIDLQAKNVPKSITNQISELIRSNIEDTGHLTVIKRTETNELLDEHDIEMQDCTNTACAIQAGKLLSVQKILIGSVMKLGKATAITVRIVDVQKGFSDYSSKQKAESDENIESAVTILSLKLVSRITGKTMSELLAEHDKRSMNRESKSKDRHELTKKTTEKEKTEKNITKTGYYLRNIVPGLGQIYSGKSTKGYIFIGGFVLTGIFSLYTLSDFINKRNAYEDLDNASKAEFDKKYNESEDAKKITTISFGIFSALYVVHWIDALFFTNPDFDNKSASRGFIKFGNTSIALNIYNQNVNLSEQCYNICFSREF